MRQRKIVPLEELPEELQMVFKLDVGEITAEEYNAWDRNKWLESEKLRREESKKYIDREQRKVTAKEEAVKLRRKLGIEKDKAWDALSSEERKATVKKRRKHKRKKEKRLIEWRKLSLHRRHCSYIATRLRARLYMALKAQGASKTSKTFDLVGCSLDELRDWLEFQFLEGMSWDNRSEWHIDHIKPCSAFDLTDEQQQQECFHWSNLQPLWAEDNLRKHDKWEED